MEAKKVVIIGGGNVAYHLIRSITASGHKLVQIYNRTLSNISNYSRDTSIIAKINSITPDADIYIICVKDTAIVEVTQNLNLGSKLVVHTSGNRSLELLKDVSPNHGVFYPIQSFTKNIPINFKKVPLIIEASNTDALDKLEKFSRTISHLVVPMNENDRQKLNVAGVFVNNFTNYIYTLAADYLEKENIDFSILQPLIQNTVDKLDLGKPADMQTGPAMRNDKVTIESHKDLLTSYPELQAIYATVTDHILKYYRK